VAARQRIPDGALRIGCSGWNYRDWAGDIYPAGLPARRWLEHYATLLATVEVNATFYRLTTRAAVERWVRQTPAGFCFAVKASRFLTHVKRLGDIAQGLERFFAPLAPLIEAGRLGPVLWQLPETFHRDDRRLEGLLEALRRYPGGRHALEIRHPSWLADEVYAILAGHGATLVIGDRRGLELEVPEAIGDWSYLRFHYGHRGRRGNYSERELDDWARRVTSLRRRGDVWAYFNNDWEGFAVRNALGLSARADPARRPRSSAAPRRSA
jgi:uncharacterized protein YecE (DUF72 family)